MEAGRLSRIAPEVWTRLGSESAHGLNLWARRAVPDVTSRLLSAVDPDGQRHLMIRLDVGDSDLTDSQSRGLEVTTRELTIRGQESGRYLDIVCRDKAGHETFDLIGGELAERLAACREQPHESVLGVLAKWRRFWGKVPQDMLSREQQLGLFAELWFLSVWLVQRVRAAEAVERWRGPFGARHDFEWLKHSVEVKGTASTRGPVHRIHGIDQLALPEHGNLLLFSLRVREEAGATNSLPAVITMCRHQISHEEEVLSKFESALMRAGYSVAHEEAYRNIRFRIVEEGLYAVRDDFPRLTPSQIFTGVPAGIEHVDYDINLGGFQHLRIAQSAAEVFDL